MKAMKATKKKTKQTETSPAQGQSPAKGQSLAKGPGILKRPSSILKLPKNEADLSLEEKMEAFQKKANGNVQTFLDSLTPGQREALWGRFSRARDALKDPKATELWNTHCKGKGSEEKKKQLLAVFLKNRGDLKKAGIYQKELVALTEVAGSLAGRTQISMGVLSAI